jgi:hypothetical protein
MIRGASIGLLVVFTVLVTAADASAESCSHLGASGDWNSSLSWDCGHVPGPADTAIVGSGDHPVVSSDPIAEPGLLGIGDSGRIVFTNEAAMRVGRMTVATGMITGAGSLTVEGEFSKGGEFGAHFSVTNQGITGPAPDLVLDGPATLSGGAMCVGRVGDGSPDHPSMTINATFTIVDPFGELAPSPFNCTSGPRVTINAPDGHLIHDADQTSWLQTMIVNDGRLTASQGELQLSGTGGQTSDGSYLAAEGAELQFDGSYLVGPTGRVGGAGTIDMKALPMTMAAGATLDPAVLDLSFGQLNLEGSAPVTLPVFKLNGVLDSDRPVTATTMSVIAGALRDDFTLTVPAGGSFAKTGHGTFAVTNSGGEGSADLVIDADARFDGGRMSIARTGDQDPDRPNLYIHRDFTIGSAVLSPAFQGGPQFGTSIHVNGPDGHVSKVGSGTTHLNDLDLAGGTLSVASGQAFAFANTYAQSAGVTEVASGGTLQASPTLTGGVLRGGGQVSGNVTNTSGTVRPGSSPGTLTVTGNYAQGAAGTLVVDVAGTARGTQYDHLSVGGAAALDGTLAVVQAGGFAPQPTDTFQFLTSASRTGAFAELAGAHLPGGKRYGLDYPGAPDFGARLVGPADLVITDCDDPALTTVTEVTGDLTADGVAGCDALELPNLTEVAGDLIIADLSAATVINLAELVEVSGVLSLNDNTAAGELDLGSLTEAGTVEITGNTAAGVLDLGSLTEAGTVEITGNGSGELDLGSLAEVSGDLSLETTGSGVLDLADVAVGGDASVAAAGYTTVTGATAGGATTIENEHPEGLMRAELPAGAFTSPVGFSITRADPAALPPEGGVDPVVAYEFDFDVPTLNSPATLAFQVSLDGLDATTRAALLAALDAGRATLATRGDAAGGTYQAFPTCAPGQAPAADGCVRVERTNDVVRFTGITGHFSTWAVAIVAPKPSPKPPGPGVTPPPPGRGPLAFGSRTQVTLRAASRRIRAKGPLRIRVANANLFEIRGRLAGVTVRRIGRRQARLPARTFRVPARASRTVALKLPQALRNRLMRRGTLALRLTATVIDPAGNRRAVKRRISAKARRR